MCFFFSIQQWIALILFRILCFLLGSNLITSLTLSKYISLYLVGILVSLTGTIPFHLPTATALPRWTPWSWTSTISIRYSSRTTSSTPSCSRRSSSCKRSCRYLSKFSPVFLALYPSDLAIGMRLPCPIEYPAPRVCSGGFCWSDSYDSWICRYLLWKYSKSRVMQDLCPNRNEQVLAHWSIPWLAPQPPSYSALSTFTLSTSKDQLYVSFNGGKDATVVLILTYLAQRR